MHDLQKKVDEVYKERGWDTAPELLLIAMQEELGEVAGRFLADHPDYQKISERESLDEEMGDLLFITYSFCNKMGLDIEECLSKTIKKRKYRKRTEKE